MPSPVPVQSIGTNSCQSASRHARSKSLSVLPLPPSSSSLSTRSGPGKRAWWQQLFVETKMTSWSKHSDLTEERVQEHNMRTAAAENTSSPYYRGLTDATLILSRQKHVTSPKTESHAKTNTSERSFTSFMSNFHIWACLPSKGNDDNDNLHNQKYVEATDGMKKPATFTLTEIGEGKRAAVVDKVDRLIEPVLTPRMNGQVGLGMEKEKSLRETVPTRTVARALSQTLVEDDRGAVLSVRQSDIFESWNKLKYVWADRYRPAALKDFICNKNKASTLISLAV